MHTSGSHWQVDSMRVDLCGLTCVCMLVSSTFVHTSQGKRGKRCIVFEDYLRKRWEIVIFIHT